MVSYDTLQSYSTEVLEEIQTFIIDELYDLQRTEEDKLIVYWSTIHAMIKGILKSRNEDNL